MSRYNSEDGTIKWQKNDLSRLKKAVTDFNKKRSKLIREEKKLEKENRIVTNTIEKEKYSEIKANIFTRKELNNYINSLRKFNNKTATDIDKSHYKQTGQKITKWQKKELDKYVAIQKIRLNKELEKYKKIVKDSGGLSKIDMRNTEAKAIQKQIENLDNYKTKSGYEYLRKVRALKQLGSLDYDFKKAIIFQQNYIETMKKFKNMKYYDKLITKLKSFKPSDFYEFIKDDMFGVDLYWISNEDLKQMEFERLLLSWDVDFEPSEFFEEEEEL